MKLLAILLSLWIVWIVGTTASWVIPIILGTIPGWSILLMVLIVIVVWIVHGVIAG